MCFILSRTQQCNRTYSCITQYCRLSSWGESFNVLIRAPFGIFHQPLHEIINSTQIYPSHSLADLLERTKAWSSCVEFLAGRAWLCSPWYHVFFSVISETLQRAFPKKTNRDAPGHKRSAPSVNIFCEKQTQSSAPSKVCGCSPPCCCLPGEVSTLCLKDSAMAACAFARSRCQELMICEMLHPCRFSCSNIF